MASKAREGVATVLTGAALGLVILGAGSRVAMHVIARMTTGRGDFSLGGTVTVVLLGAASGAVAGLILFLARLVFRRRPLLATLLAWTAVIGLTLRGLKPLDNLRVALFLPLVVAFLLLLQWATRRRVPVTRYT